MKSYRYKAVTEKGAVIEAKLDAADEQDLARQIDRRGMILISSVSLNEHTSSRQTNLSLLSLRRLQNKDVTEFLQNLSALLNASIRLDQALDMLSQKEFGGVMSGIAAALRQSILSGESLSDALSHHEHLFARPMIALIAISEKSGTLAKTMTALSEKRDREEKLRQKVFDSLTYPAFLICAVFALFFFFVVFILPQFKSFVTDMVKNADPVLIALLGLSDFLTTHSFGVFVAIGAAILLAILYLRSSERRNRLLSVLLQLPLIRSVDRDYGTAQFCRNFGLLAEYGLPMADAIDLAGRSISVHDRGEIFSIARDKVRQGQTVGSALEATGVLAPIAIRMIRIGEESGMIAELARKTADLFDARVERKFQQFVDLIGPIAVLLVSLLVGGLTLSIMTALLSVNQLVG